VYKREIELADLSWLCDMSKEIQTAQTDDTGIDRSFKIMRKAYAAFDTIAPLSMLNNIQLDQNKLTHTIIVRWFDNIDEFWYIFRNKRIQETGKTRRERYRIHQREDMDGRQRFIKLYCEFQGYECEGVWTGVV
jgi:hypothetical protein